MDCCWYQSAVVRNVYFWFRLSGTPSMCGLRLPTSTRSEPAWRTPAAHHHHGRHRRQVNHDTICCYFTTGTVVFCAGIYPVVLRFSYTSFHSEYIQDENVTIFYFVHNCSSARERQRYAITAITCERDEIMLRASVALELGEVGVRVVHPDESFLFSCIYWSIFISGKEEVCVCVRARTCVLAIIN